MQQPNTADDRRINHYFVSEATNHLMADRLHPPALNFRTEKADSVAADLEQDGGFSARTMRIPQAGIYIRKPEHLRELDLRIRDIAKKKMEQATEAKRRASAEIVYLRPVLRHPEYHISLTTHTSASPISPRSYVSR